jgi:hypothetical protein
MHGCFSASSIAAVVAFSLVIWMARGLAVGPLGVSVASATATPRSRSGGLVLVMRPFPRVKVCLGT